ncbi:MAG: DUF4190 domain-containing protein [Bacteroidia bacterium]
MELKDYMRFLLIVFTIFFASCSLQKRHYREGFYVGNKNRVQTNEQSIGNKSKEGGIELITIPTKTPKQRKETTISVSKDKFFILIQKPLLSTPHSVFTSGCDTIFLNNGTTLICKIDEVTKRSVKFKNCNDSIEVSNSIDAELVSGIKFNNGRELLISKTSDNNKPFPTKNNYLIKGRLVDIGLAMGILAILSEGVLLLALFHIIALATGLAVLLIIFNAIALVLSIVFGFKSLKEIRKTPQIFKGKKMATWEIVLGFLSIVSWLIILIAISIV